MAVQMQRVHAELKASVWGAWMRHLTEPAAPVPAPSVTRLLEMWDYEASLTIQVTVLTLVSSLTGTVYLWFYGDHDCKMSSNNDSRISNNMNNSNINNVINVAQTLVLSCQSSVL